MMDINNSNNANSARIKALSNNCSREVVNGPSVHPPGDDVVDGSPEVPNSAVVIQDARADRKP